MTLTTDEYFGGCPHCGKQTNCVNVTRVHVAMCDEHKVCWVIGENLFSSWRNEDEDTWRRNAELLAEYTAVRPIFPEPTSGDAAA